MLTLLSGRDWSSRRIRRVSALAITANASLLGVRRRSTSSHCRNRGVLLVLVGCAVLLLAKPKGLKTLRLFPGVDDVCPSACLALCHWPMQLQQHDQLLSPGRCSCC